MKSDIYNFKCLFQVEDDGRNVGNGMCIAFLPINKELSNFKSLYYLVWLLERKKVVPSSELYLVFE